MTEDRKPRGVFPQPIEIQKVPVGSLDLFPLIVEGLRLPQKRCQKNLQMSVPEVNGRFVEGVIDDRHGRVLRRTQ
jgi:hypothetical protein